MCAVVFRNESEDECHFWNETFFAFWMGKDKKGKLAPAAEKRAPFSQSLFLLCISYMKSNLISSPSSNTFTSNKKYKTYEKGRVVVKE